MLHNIQCILVSLQTLFTMQTHSHTQADTDTILLSHRLAKAPMSMFIDAKQDSLDGAKGNRNCKTFAMTNSQIVCGCVVYVLAVVTIYCRDF